MKFAETEGTGISFRAETESTGISHAVETEGTGTGLQSNTRGRCRWLGGSVLLLCLAMLSPMLSAAELRLYSMDGSYVKGIYSDQYQTVFVEGLLNQYDFELIAQSSLLPEQGTNATGEGTGGDSTEATGEGTGGETTEATGEGTGGESTEATGEGTGGESTEATGEGTGGLMNQTSTNSIIELSFDCQMMAAFGTASTGNETINLDAIEVTINGQPMSCQFE